ncbi:MAG: DUF4350 domain-containing protein [Acidimicrobiia bacterium]|nr:DUF4350 domain-containing protein [Acidimicrobiia bacterium]MDH5291165.1 DUF4350 domain-containing protein [Acidimicrobiia bacterium]
MNRRATAFWAVLAVLLLGIGLLSGRQRRDGDPLDPDATNTTGTAALLALLDETGTPVERGLPADRTATVLVLDDRLTVDQRRTLSTWVGHGGTLVVADPFSPFAPGLGAGDGVAVTDVEAGPCPLPGLDGLDLDGDEFRLYRPVRSSPAGPAPVRPGPDGATEFVAAHGCFGTAGDYLQVSPQGRGRVVALGGADPLTNQFLDEADNAVLAVNLLAPEGADDPVSVLYGPLVSPGSRQLGDLVPSWTMWVAWQLGAAFALFVVWRIRRFGHPVPEPQPVELPASLLVRATGELRRRSGAVPEASDVLRRDLEQRLRRQLKVSPETPTAELAGRAAALAGLDPERVARALAGPPAGTGGELAGLVADIDAVNQAFALTATAGRETAAAPSRGEHL